MNLLKEDIEFVVKQLLYDFDCIVIPGFGGFIARNLPAEANIKHGTFIPPRRMVGFNALLTSNDGFLTHAISRKFNFSYNESQQFLYSYVRKIQEQLHNFRKYSFEGIGTFSLGENDALLFEPNNQLNLSKHAFGLVSFTLQAGRQVQTNPGLKPQMRKVSGPNYVYRNSVRRVLSYAAAIAAIGIISFTIKPAAKMFSEKAGFDLFRIEYDQSEKSIESPEKSFHANFSTVNESNQISNNTNADQAVSESVNPIEQPVPEFHLIAGSFKKLSNARKLSSLLQSRGFDAQVLVCGEAKIRVSMSHYKNKKDALVELDLQRTQMPNIWLYKL